MKPARTATLSAPPTAVLSPAVDAGRHDSRLLPWLAVAITLLAAVVAIEPLPVGVF